MYLISWSCSNCIRVPFITMEKLSVVIITKNEQNYISEALKSAQFANEIVVLDSGSNDKTCEIAREFGAKVYEHEWLGFGAQKNKAVSLAQNNWVFVLDADERITVELANEITNLLMHSNKVNAYYVARLNYFFGNPIKTCGLYPDYSIRLFNRTKARFNEVAVHESVQIDEKVGKLQNHMLHLAYVNIEEFIEKQNKYSSLHHKKGRIKALVSPWWTFFKLYVIKRGFCDGWRGFVISVLYSQYTFWKYIK